MRSIHVRTHEYAKTNFGALYTPYSVYHMVHPLNSAVDSTDKGQKSQSDTMLSLSS